MSGQLFIVATPIGNLDDITLRAIQTLREVDLVAAEDTRHSLRLLRHLGVDTPMLSLHEHNEHARIDQLLSRLDQGQDIALVSDAGTPLLSDPGFPLVRAVVAAGFRVVPIPGPSSIVAALCAAGLPTDHFTFHGFLSSRASEQSRQLLSLRHQHGTQVLLESTHRIERLLSLIDELIPSARLVIAKELTKRHETFIRGSAADCLARISQQRDLLKGEFVVLLHVEQTTTDLEHDQPTMNIDVHGLLSRLMQELPLKQAVRIVADASGLKRNALYDQALSLQRQATKT